MDAYLHSAMLYAEAGISYGDGHYMRVTLEESGSALRAMVAPELWRYMYARQCRCLLLAMICDMIGNRLPPDHRINSFWLADMRRERQQSALRARALAAVQGILCVAANLAVPLQWMHRMHRVTHGGVNSRTESEFGALLARVFRNVATVAGGALTPPLNEYSATLRAEAVAVLDGALERVLGLAPQRDATTTTTTTTPEDDNGDNSDSKSQNMLLDFDPDRVDRLCLQYIDNMDRMVDTVEEVLFTILDVSLE